MSDVSREAILSGVDELPDVLIGLDLPLRGRDSWDAQQARDAVEFVLARSGWRAGEHVVGLRTSDTSSVEAAKWDESRCEANASRLVGDERVVAVIGGWNAGCAEVQLPILNEAGLALIGIATTYAGLTVAVEGCEPDEPSRYLPTGKRTFVRMIGNDFMQGRALASLAERDGVQRLFVLHSLEGYGRPIAEGARATAGSLGLEIVGFEEWNPDAESFHELMTNIDDVAADGLILSGLADDNGPALLQDKVAVLGSNDEVKVYVADGFMGPDFLEEAGRAADGLFGVVPCPPLEELDADGSELLSEFARWNDLDERDLSSYAPLALQAASVAVTAIAESDGTRAQVRDVVFSGRDWPVGPLAGFAFSETGDPAATSMTVYGCSRRDWYYVGGVRVT